MDNQSGPGQLELFVDEPFALRVPIEDAIRLFWDNHWVHLPSAKAGQNHFRRLRSFFKGFYLDSISKADVERFRRFMKEAGYKPATINKAHMILSRIFSKFHEYREGGFLNGTDMRRLILPEKNPCSLVPKEQVRPGHRAVPSPTEVRKIAAYADHEFRDHIYGLYWTMLRQSDFYKITDKNVDLKSMALRGIQSKTVTRQNPSGVPYLVPLTDECADLIIERLARVKPGTPLFRPTNKQKRFERARTRAGLIWVTMESLRHAGATYLLDHGTDPYTVAALLGHTSLRCLPNYTPRTPKHLSEAAEKLARS